MNRQILDRGRDISGADFERFASIPFPSKPVIDSQGALQGVNRYEVFQPFNLITLVSAATTVAQIYTNNINFTHNGTGTEVIALSDKGGTSYTSQATTPADNDNVLLLPVATSTAFYAKLTVGAEWRLEARLQLTKATACFFTFGFNENVTDADPTGTAGEGAMFGFDPTGEFFNAGTGSPNWLLIHKVNGVDTAAATTVPVIAGVDYEFVIKIGTDLKANFYINGVLAGTGPALTDGDTVGVFAGIELTATPAEQKAFEIRYIGLSRALGA
jgi:hypothetical protein